MSEGSKVKIEFVLRGPNFSNRETVFPLEKYALSYVLDCWESVEENFDIRLYVNDVLHTKPIIGATNQDKIENLKTLLKDLWEKTPFILKDGNGFRLIMAQKALFSPKKKK